MKKRASHHDGRELATFTDTPQREADRQAAIRRWKAQRDLVAQDLKDAAGDPARQREAEALLAHIDAVLADLEIGMVPAARLTTLERRLAEFRSAPVTARLGRVSADLRKYRKGRRRGSRDALGLALLAILSGDPKKSSDEVKKALRKADIVEAVVLHPMKGEIVRWRNLKGRVHRTSWRSIRDSRLPKLRRQAKALTIPTPAS